MNYWKQLYYIIAPKVSKQDARVPVDIANFSLELYPLQYFQIPRTKLSPFQAGILPFLEEKIVSYLKNFHKLISRNAGGIITSRYDVLLKRQPLWPCKC